MRYDQCDATCTADCGHCKGRRFGPFATTQTAPDDYPSTEEADYAPGWYVVVDRLTMALVRLDPYVLGPYATEAEAVEECQSDEGIAFCLLTIDAKSEGYIADECFSTDKPPRGRQIIPSTPDPEDLITP